MIRFYLSPAITNAAGFRAPKYSNVPPRGTPQEWMDLGNEPTFLWAFDADVTVHGTVAANADVAAFPYDLDSQVGAALATVQAKLESFNIPGDAVTAATRYRTIIRGLISITDVMARYSAITQNVLLFDAGVNLDRTLGSIPAIVRNALQQACNERGYDTSSLTGASTIRDLFKTLAVQARDVSLLGVVV